MAIAVFSLPKKGINLAFGQLLQKARDLPFIATENAYPPAVLTEWVRLTSEQPGESEFDLSATGTSDAWNYVTRGLTQTATDFDLGQLEAVAQAGDDIAFTMAVHKMNWDNRPANDFVRAVRLALLVGAHMIARQLSAEGVKGYPNHPELQRLADLLAPPKIINAHLPPDPNAYKDMRWLKTHHDEYQGQWVALRGDDLIAVAPSRKELLAKLENPKDKTLLITPVY